METPAGETFWSSSKCKPLPKPAWTLVRIKTLQRARKITDIVFFRGNSIFIYFSLKVLLCLSMHSSWCPTQKKMSILVGGKEEQAQTRSNSTKWPGPSVILRLSATHEGVIVNREPPINDLMELQKMSPILCIPFKLNKRWHLYVRRNICREMSLYGIGL